jgi:hypothetical protein
LIQLFQLAAKCATKFENIAIIPGGEDAASGIAAALIEATWECGVIRDDIPGTIERFIQNLSVLFSKWPPITRAAHLALAGVTQRMPLEHQRSLWRGILSRRAWS